MTVEFPPIQSTSPPTRFEFEIEYRGPLDRILRLLETVKEQDLDYDLAAGSNRGYAVLTVATSNGSRGITVWSALQDLKLVHDQGRDLGLTYPED